MYHCRTATLKNALALILKKEQTNNQKEKKIRGKIITKEKRRKEFEGDKATKVGKWISKHK